MRRAILVAMWMGSLATMTACMQKPVTDSPQSDRKMNPAMSATSARTPAVTGDADADDPKSGMNTSRPDSTEDLPPESQRATPAPR